MSVQTKQLAIKKHRKISIKSSSMCNAAAVQNEHGVIHIPPADSLCKPLDTPTAGVGSSVLGPGEPPCWYLFGKRG